MLLQALTFRCCLSTFQPITQMSWLLWAIKRTVLFWSSCGHWAFFTKPCGWGWTSTKTVRVVIAVPHPSPSINFHKSKPSVLDNSMVWMDGSPVDYNNWPNKSPDPKLVSADTCVTTRGLDGVWHLSQCTEQLGFICKTTTSKLNHHFYFASWRC